MCSTESRHQGVLSRSSVFAVEYSVDALDDRHDESSMIRDDCLGRDGLSTFPVAEPCSSETTGEVDDASPFSVLEAPFTEDSSSESFERVNTELHEADPDMLGETWYAPECPLHPSVFDNLEKKYSEETTALRSERRLLFDRIFSSLLEFLLQHVDSFTLVLPNIIGVSSKWEKQRVEDAIWKLLTGQVLQVNMDLSD
ncbi:Uncharacterized protein Fot_29004 [Forsythia ovata]|uniref:DUF4378 domain-containing protein n=1 Tax=Forsythia ovata TaxID=205694 RepID=A0ABD1TR19_9LAMI